MNERSSRSHAIFTLSLAVTCENERGVKETKSSKFTFVDLAGSERANKSGVSGSQLKEAGLINKSLLTLGKVITSLAEPLNSLHVSYRDSKLTRLLRESLGGNSRVSFTY